MWTPFKPTVDREAELTTPPPLRDRLDEKAASRLAHTMISTLEISAGGVIAACQNFGGYLAHQAGHRSYSHLPHKKEHLHADDIIFDYILISATDPTNLSRTLDWYAQYFVQTAQSRPSWGFDDKIARVNHCLQHDACIYRIEKDSKYSYAVHKIGSEVAREQMIKPALSLLREHEAEDALREYEEALVLWARGKHDDAIRQASHAVESTMKFVLTKLGVTHKPDANPSALINHVVKDAQLIPQKYEHFWTQLSQGIQGVITVRNSAPGAGHGPAPGAEDPDDATSEYAVHMAGANIIYLLRRWRAKGAGE